MRRAALSVGTLLAGVLATPLLATSPAPADALAAGSTYVALGDSYSSAPGVPDYIYGTRCSRSTHNYAHLTAADLGLTLSDATCAGAASQHLTESQYDSNGQLVQGPQFDALTPDAALVTLGLGGNDGDYFWDMLVGWSMAGGDAAATDQIRADVVRDVAQIRAIAPHARVVVVGYPALYPASGWCDELLLPPEQVPLAYARNKALADAMRTAAAESGTDFIELFDRSAGHDICSPEPWVQGKTGVWGVATPFHPRIIEQEAVRDALVQLVGPVDPPTPSESPTVAPSATPTATATPSPTPVASATPSATISATPTPTPAPTVTATAPTATASPGVSPTPTASTSVAPTATATATQAPTSTPTPSATTAPTLSPTPTPSATTSATPTASPTTATASATPTASTSTAPTPTTAPTPATAAPAMPTVTWYPKQGSPLIRHWVAVPPPRCSPAVCTVDYRWQVNAVPVGTGGALYLRRVWRGKYVSVRVTVHAHGMAWTRTYRWLRPIHRG